MMPDISKSLHAAIALLAIALLCLPANGQDDRKYLRKGNREYRDGNFSDAEILYRKAGDANTQSTEATFNTGDALYRQKKYEDAGQSFTESTTKTIESQKKAAGFYNLGNSMLQANKLKESIEAYKNSLKLDPGNLEAKYNLGYAQNLLREQEQQQQQQQQNKDQQQDQDKQNDQEQQQQDQQEQQGQNEQDKQQQQQQEQGISKEDAERLLNALANDEKEVQEKVKREKAARARTRALKNW